MGLLVKAAEAVLASKLALAIHPDGAGDTALVAADLAAVEGFVFATLFQCPLCRRAFSWNLMRMRCEVHEICLLDRPPAAAGSDLPTQNVAQETPVDRKLQDFVSPSLVRLPCAQWRGSARNAQPRKHTPTRRLVGHMNERPV